MIKINDIMNSGIIDDSVMGSGVMDSETTPVVLADILDVDGGVILDVDGNPIQGVVE